MEDPHMHLHTYEHLVFDKIHTGEKMTASSVNDLKSLSNWVALCRRMKLGLHFSSCTNFNYKWIKDLNLRPDALTL